MQYLNFETLNEFYFGYFQLSDSEQLEHICNFIKTIDAIDDDLFPCAVLLVAAITEGTDPDTLAHFCRMPLAFVTEVAARLEASKIWLNDGTLDYEFLTAKNEEFWRLCFLVEALVARGIADTDGVKSERGRGYRLSEAGRLKVAADRALQESTVVQ
jgi:hypothetical protein